MVAVWLYTTSIITRIPARCNAITICLNSRMRTSGLIRVGSIRTFGNVVILRVVSPVILRNVGLGLVDRRKVERGEQVHMRYSQFLQMVDTCLFAQVRSEYLLRSGPEIFHGCLNPRHRVDREIAVVHFINNQCRKSFSGEDACHSSQPCGIWWKSRSITAARSPFTPTALAITPGVSPCHTSFILALNV